MNTWISFTNERPSASGKTKVWNVTTNDEGLFLGQISWYGQWRKYVFFPKAGTLFEEECLHNIANFCWKKTDEHRKAQKAK